VLITSHVGDSCSFSFLSKRLLPCNLWFLKLPASGLWCCEIDTCLLDQWISLISKNNPVKVSVRYFLLASCLSWFSPFPFSFPFPFCFLFPFPLSLPLHLPLPPPQNRSDFQPFSVRPGKASPSDSHVRFCLISSVPHWFFSSFPSRQPSLLCWL